ncbi:MAG: hypothetical protein EA351_00895 [Gemmatimonadales bacterium]|nr:MAG: hypothetical protein EA351_00895 [Gemmatimonadales bacterium]
MTDQTNKSDFIDGMKERLDTLDAEMNRIQDKVDETSDEARGELQSQLAKMREKRETLAGHVAEMRAAGEKQKGEIQRKVEDSWKAFENSFKYFKSHFK